MRTLLFFIFLQLHVSAQEVYKSPFEISLGIAPNYYVNNIVTFGQYVKPLNYSFMSRVMWHSKYKISLGLGVGIHKLYQVEGFSSNTSDFINLLAIPVQFTIGMKWSDRCYNTIAFGPSWLINNASLNGTREHSVTLSTSDIQASVGYHLVLKKHFSLSTEFSYFISTKNEDMNFSIPIIASFKF